MMTNIFLSFDPGSSVFSFSWMILFMSIFFVTLKMWKISSNKKMMMKGIFLFMSEIKFSLGEMKMSTFPMLILSLFFIFLMNFIALFPHLFSVTSHLSICLPMSLIFWLSIVMFGWLNKTSKMLSHMLPQGTPMFLMMFMVVIELISNIIRPITLCVRLSANLIAGHLLMTLLSNFLIWVTITFASLLMPILLLLTILEIAVSMIQAYVFMTLLTLYVLENK